jgi:hypothetical protein
LTAYAVTALYGFQPKKPAFRRVGWLCKGLAGLLLIILLSTGIIDIITYHNGNGKNKSYQAPLNSAFHTWLLKNTEPGDVFASAWHTIHPVFLAGRFEYMGWPYYAWSAGYDTGSRGDILKAMFASGDPNELRRLTRENRISYILIDPGLLSNPEFTVNEANIHAAYPLAYADESAGIRVYQTDYAMTP